MGSWSRVPKGTRARGDCGSLRKRPQQRVIIVASPARLSRRHWQRFAVHRWIARVPAPKDKPCLPGLPASRGYCDVYASRVPGATKRREAFCVVGAPKARRARQIGPPFVCCVFHDVNMKGGHFGSVTEDQEGPARWQRQTKAIRQGLSQRLPVAEGYTTFAPLSAVADAADGSPHALDRHAAGPGRDHDGLEHRSDAGPASERCSRPS